MTPFYQNESVTIFHADCRDVMRSLPENSIDSIVTDPPYGLNFMGKEWDRLGDKSADFTNLDRPHSSQANFAMSKSRGRPISETDGPAQQAWHYLWAVEALRVLKPGGYLLAFGGSRTYHRLACAIEDAGFEIRDQIQWIYGSGFPKSLDISKAIDAAAGVEREIIGLKGTAPDIRGNSSNGNGISSDASKLKDRLPNNITVAATDAAKQWDGWGTALKPAHEPIVLARKPLVGTVAQNVLEHGTGGLNIDGCRIGTGEDKTEGGCNGKGNIFGQSGLSQQATTDFTVGRWPANVIHDGSDEVLAGFPQSTSEGGSRPIETGRSIGTFEEKMHRPFTNFGDSGSAARFFYCAKASKEDRDDGLHSVEMSRSIFADGTGLRNNGDGTPRNITPLSRNHHPTVKPTSLMRYLVRLVTPYGGTALDPFAGSGSTGKACAHEGMKAILIEKEIEYCELAKRRAQLAQGRFCFEEIKP